MNVQEDIVTFKMLEQNLIEHIAISVLTGGNTSSSDTGSEDGSNFGDESNYASDSSVTQEIGQLCIWSEFGTRHSFGTTPSIWSSPCFTLFSYFFLYHSISTRIFCIPHSLLLSVTAALVEQIPLLNQSSCNKTGLYNLYKEIFRFHFETSSSSSILNSLVLISFVLQLRFTGWQTWATVSKSIETLEDQCLPTNRWSESATLQTF